ncbi:hypothetical protein VTI74DRAFT_4270 [Chaetomium olivicolor]
MAPTKPEENKTTTSADANPIDLTSVTSGRITKSTPKAKRTKKLPDGADDPTSPFGAGSTPRTKKRPSCAACRKSKARCDPIFACEKCTKAGVDCTGASEEQGAGSVGAKARPGACERCKTRKMKSRRGLDGWGGMAGVWDGATCVLARDK